MVHIHQMLNLHNYTRAVHLLIVVGICLMHMMYMRLPEWIGQPINSCLKALTTRCSLHFCKMHGFNCEFACVIMGTLMPGAAIISAIRSTIFLSVYVPAILFIVRS